MKKLPKFLTLLFFLIFVIGKSQTKKIIFWIKTTDYSILELNIKNVSKKTQYLAIDTSNLRFSDNLNYNMNYEMFLSNTFIFNKTNGYGIPFTLLTTSHRDCFQFGENFDLTMQNYLQSHILKINPKETKKIIYNFSAMKNIRYSRSNTSKKINYKVIIKYRGKSIKKYLENCDCNIDRKILKNVLFENISSNKINMELRSEKITFPSSPE